MREGELHSPSQNGREDKTLNRVDSTIMDFVMTDGGFSAADFAKADGVDLMEPVANNERDCGESDASVRTRARTSLRAREGMRARARVRARAWRRARALRSTR